MAFVGGPVVRGECGRRTTVDEAVRRRSIRRFGRGVATMQTWSDSRLREEYFDFLEKKNRKSVQGDQKSIIVGTGRIGSLLLKHGNGDDIVVRRGEQIPDEPGPVYLCTRNDTLDDIIKNCPKNKLEDLVFLQNGYLDPLLRKYTLVDDVTLANIYFAVSKKGEDPIDGKTEKSPEGLTCVTGKWAEAFAERLAKANLSCRVINKRDFRRSQLEKLIWISAFMLIGAVHGNITVGEVESKHRNEVGEMVGEMALMLRTTLATVLFPELESRLCAYSRVVKDFPTGLKEFEWRNGFFYNFTKLAKDRGFPDPTPMHTNYLEDGKARGLIDW
eukprot:Plantae.Rhodophyta-Purpureofilum_apyrenoidigerum.ctg25538.p1 GENE.Plantae.Rhodophyta-Purpureofilum_apyrenoidigerum.ctg25538~~Plantae.Rhodophyta-Purpureofilum_apyrenoidigerum.ctg25538.p1  ORF type:complete len:330 (+),score=74.01 Plantae.Rhodophyta-Purpureofilum_apyrenoidigerum.ctg25538:183-1172(+)